MDGHEVFFTGVPWAGLKGGGLTSVKPTSGDLGRLFSDTNSPSLGTAKDLRLGFRHFVRLWGELEAVQEPVGASVFAGRLELRCTMPVLGFWFKWPGVASRK